MDFEKMLLRRANEARWQAYQTSDPAIRLELESEANQWFAMFKAWVMRTDVQ